MPELTAAPRVLCVVGARPNFMKTVPVIRELSARGTLDPILVHTGQHYDEAMSAIFLDELGVGTPDHMLGVGSASHAVQTARIMERIEPVLIQEQPDLVLVPGDVNSTIAAALVAAKLRIPVGHLEAGLRSFDRTMPEELNRILTDQLSDLLFIHSPEARENLLRENIDGRAIHDVGNTMIDTLVAMRGRIDDAGRRRPARPRAGGYLRRHASSARAGRRGAAGRRDRARSSRSRASCRWSSRSPPHAGADGLARPRTGARAVQLTEPLGYLDFLALVGRAARRADRLRRHPGGDDVPRHPMLHAARQHRAARDLRDRDERPAGLAPGSHPRSCRR